MIMPFLQQKLNNYDVFALKRHARADVVSKVDLFDRWKNFLKKNRIAYYHLNSSNSNPVCGCYQTRYA